jgi:cytoskeletal protein RodZ
MALFVRRKHGGRVVADAQDDDQHGAWRPATIGDLLRERREQYGTTLEQVGAALRIRPVFLRAIEDNRYDRLPGPVYALGFVRTYADYLGLDGEVIAQRFKSEAAGLETKSELSFPMPSPERSMPGGALLLVALIIAACAYAVWYYRAAGERTRIERVAEVPSQLIPLPPPVPEPNAVAESPGPTANAPVPSGTALGASVPAASPSGVQVAAVPPSPAAAPPDVTPAPIAPAGHAPAAVEPPGAPDGRSGNPLATLPRPVAPAPTPPTEPPRLPTIPEPPGVVPALDTPRVYGVTNGPVRIIIKATADSWVQVRDADQAVISMRVLKQGETYRVPDRPGLILRTGNAGGLEITVDGRPVGPVGPIGKTRNLALDPERLLAGGATPE